MMPFQPPRTITVVHETKKGDDKHTFVFKFNEDTASEALQQVGKIVSDPELPFSWYDVAVVAQEIRNEYWALQNPAVNSADPLNTTFVRRS
jgi:hypothetical protein